jgi:hypothetical protein
MTHLGFLLCNVCVTNLINQTRYKRDFQVTSSLCHRNFCRIVLDQLFFISTLEKYRSKICLNETVNKEMLDDA